MSELSFLLELLLNHKLPKVTRDAIATRIKDVESSYAVRSPSPGLARQVAPAELQGQAPSTVAAMMRHNGGDPVALASSPEPPPVAVIAHTPAAVAAMNSRNKAINDAMNQKVDKQLGRPRKF